MLNKPSTTGNVKNAAAAVKPPVIDTERIRRRMKVVIEFLQAGTDPASFAPPFTLEKIEHMVGIFLSLVNYKGEVTKDVFAGKIKNNAGPEYVEIKTNRSLIDAIMAEKDFVELIQKL